MVPIDKAVKVEYSLKNAQVVELAGEQVVGAATEPKLEPDRLHCACRFVCKRTNAQHRAKNRVIIFIVKKSERLKKLGKFVEKSRATRLATQHSADE